MVSIPLDLCEEAPGVIIGYFVHGPDSGFPPGGCRESPEETRFLWPLRIIPTMSAGSFLHTQKGFLFL